MHYENNLLVLNRNEFELVRSLLTDPYEFDVTQRGEYYQIYAKASNLKVIEGCVREDNHRRAKLMIDYW